MKKILSTLAFIGIFSASAFAFGEDVPAAVKTKFAAEYPNAKKVKWDNEDGKYEVHFEVNGAETSATYDANANKLATESEVEVSALPKGIADYFAKNHPGQKIQEAVKITDDKGTITYEAESKAGDFIFDANGNFLNKKEKKEEKEDDDDDDDDDKEKKNDKK